MKTKYTLIIGAGQVGTALHNILKKHYKCYLTEYNMPHDLKDVGVMHICIPYSDKFIKYVKQYIKDVNPDYTIIHSTVPVGTTDKLKAYHSPIRGTHPHLEESIRTFVKYLAPESDELKRYFEKARIKIRMYPRPAETEALKLWSTTQYGMDIIMQKKIFEWCQKKRLVFETIYTDANRTYNEGYEKLGKWRYKRPTLLNMEGKIGGHCIMPNCELLDSDITKLIIKLNKKLEARR